MGRPICWWKAWQAVNHKMEGRAKRDSYQGDSEQRGTEIKEGSKEGQRVPELTRL